jgi:hypothetical protein
VVRHKNFLYRAASWEQARRVVARVEFQSKRRTAEQRTKEGNQEVAMMRISCHRCRANEMRLGLSLIVYNLGNLCRRLRLPAPIEKWSLTSLQQRLVKTVGRLIPHARYYCLQLADGHLTLRLNQASKRQFRFKMPGGSVRNFVCERLVVNGYCVAQQSP